MTSQVSTDRFRRQHAELYELAQELLAVRDPDEVSAQAIPLRSTLARLLGKLRVHAAMEEQALYPRMLADPDPKVREIGERFLREVEPIYRKVFEIAEHWPTAESIKADAPGFVADTRRILKTLGERVMSETSELYPLIDERDAK